MTRRALIVQGGWQGHQPQEVADIFRRLLGDEGFDVEVADTLDAFRDEARLMALSLIVPVWTMGKIEKEQLQPVLNAVQSGVGLAGCHGGMCDSFRDAVEWQWMTGGQWVAHPGNDGTRYTVRVGPTPHAITEGIGDFEVTSEQYYLHVDPAVTVLATTTFPVADGPHASNGTVEMPQIWLKRWGNGRVFYNALGHQANVIDREPCLTLTRRGFLWAAR